MKKILSIIIAIGLVSCASTEEMNKQRDAELEQKMTMELGCTKLEGFKVTGTQGGKAFENNWTIYMVGNCDSKPARCKEYVEILPGTISFKKTMTCSKS